MTNSTVKITATGVSQLEDSTAVFTISKQDIRLAKLTYLAKSRHPFLQFLIGFGLLASGLVLIIMTFIIVEVGVVIINVWSYTLSIPVVPIALWLMVGTGLWLIIGVFRGRYNIMIQTDQGISNIFFGESANIIDILNFIRRANQELGYNIDISITKTMYIRDSPSDRPTEMGP